MPHYPDYDDPYVHRMPLLSRWRRPKKERIFPEEEEEPPPPPPPPPQNPETIYAIPDEYTYPVPSTVYHLIDPPPEGYYWLYLDDPNNPNYQVGRLEGDPTSRLRSVYSEMIQWNNDWGTILGEYRAFGDCSGTITITDTPPE